jgi:hypothetical protein
MALDSTAEELGTAFGAAAKTYCDLFENRTAYSPAGFLGQLQVALPVVYAAGARLPVIEPGDDEEEIARPVDAHIDLMRQLADFLGPYNHYWEVYDPAKPEGDEKLPVVLADDLIDIYFELKEGLELWSRGNESDLRNAIFGWRLGWETHWGAHAVDALRAIHWHVETHWLDAEEPLSPVPPKSAG